MNCVTLFALMCWCVLCGQAMHLMRPRPRPLDSAETWNNLNMMTKKAQSNDRDHETRLIPVISSERLKEEETCCVNAMILNYYLKNILHQHPSDESYPSINFVRSDLHRIARDLEPHCKKTDFSEHAHVKKFTGNYKKASDLYGDETKARNKAVGETDILFHYLYESCTPRKRL
ncbi:interleukin-22 [Triplophysa rosa]|uniref:Interleukin 22 n=1 Tax=Triplophysa rosa TaxID=992332 RepID=A0A9W7W918_TRIRA|nr:interleukin-22 [Triplophysa rosa]KAI7791701.1 interleukin 22 [Triplophysa rosa]